jgi:hypothetical protein
MGFNKKMNNLNLPNTSFFESTIEKILIEFEKKLAEHKINLDEITFRYKQWGDLPHEDEFTYHSSFGNNIKIKLRTYL